MAKNSNSVSLASRRSAPFLVASLLLCLLAAPSSAVSIFAAYWDTNDLGEAGGLGLGFQFGGKFALDIAGTYYEELDEDPLALLEDGESPFIGNGLEVIPIDVGFLYRSNGGRGAGFYVGAGATLFMIDSSAPGVVTDDESGWYLKAGFDLAGGNRGPTVFIEGLLRQVDAEVGTELGFLDNGSGNLSLDLEGVSLHVGVRF